MELLPFDTMKVVIWDLLNAEEWNKTLLEKDTALLKMKNNLKLYQQALLMHQITKEQFFYSYKFYEEHPDKMKALLDSLAIFGQKQKDGSLRTTMIQ